MKIREYVDRKLEVIFQQITDFYNRYHAVIKTFLIALFIFSIINYLNTQHSYYFNQEIFDLNSIPSGHVVWVYPLDKTQNPTMPDSIMQQLNIKITRLNYNVDTWVVGIETPNHQIIKIEVPDYAISYFKLGSDFRNPTSKD